MFNSPRAVTITRSHLLHHCSRLLGQMSPLIFVLLLEGKAKGLKDCGTVTMPSAEAMADAHPDIQSRFQAIETVNLSSMNNLTGRYCEG